MGAFIYVIRTNGHYTHYMDSSIIFNMKAKNEYYLIDLDSDRCESVTDLEYRDWYHNIAVF